MKFVLLIGGNSQSVIFFESSQGVYGGLVKEDMAKEGGLAFENSIRRHLNNSELKS